MPDLARRPGPSLVSPARALAGLGSSDHDAREEGLKDAMRHLVGAVCVVTAGLGAERTGATVTSAHSFSVEPETMVVSINLASSTWTAIRRHGAFCVNVLAAGQRDVAHRFTGIAGVKGVERYRHARWSTLATGAGVLDGALASIDCMVDTAIERHSHALIFGAVQAVTTNPGDALLYSHGGYGTYPPRL